MNESVDKESLGEFAEILSLPQESQWAMMSRLGSVAGTRADLFGVFRKPEYEEAIQRTWSEVLGNMADEFAKEIDRKYMPESESKDSKTVAQRELFIKLLRDNDYETVMSAHNALRYIVKPQIVLKEPSSGKYLSGEEIIKRTLSMLNSEQIDAFKLGLEQSNPYGEWIYKYLEELKPEDEAMVEDCPPYHQKLWLGKSEDVIQDVEACLESIKTQLMFVTARRINPDLRDPSVEKENAVLDRVLEIQSSGDPVKGYAEWVISILPRDSVNGQILEEYKTVEKVMKGYIGI